MDKALGTANDLIDDGVKFFLVYDFDGVFNVMYRNGTFKKDFYNPTHTERHPNPHYTDLQKKFAASHRKAPKSYELVWSDELIKDSNKLSARDDVQVLWLTTWRQYMKDVSHRLGFEYVRNPLYVEWGTNEYDTDHFSKIDGFLNFFKNFKNDDVGVLWADDVVHKNPALVRKEVESVSSLNHDNLQLLCPNDWYGISRKEWNGVKDFAKDFLN